ncbi:MAG TPA: flavin reductase family protein [Alphaproteobacteria bacterium]|jgi:flavin reductase (DIM6/NTAB) family NADH-FMN oxidoreductase RutF
MVNKIDVKKEWWDNIFAPSSALAVITTVDNQGRVNAASFGTCTRVCHDPVYIAFTVGADKDTANNIRANGEFTVNLVPFEQEVLNKIVVCGLSFKAGINELERAGLGQVPSRVVKPPRVLECRSHFECRVEWTQQWLHRLMICGKVEAVSVNEDCMDKDGNIIWDHAKPAHYCGHPYQGSFVPAYDKPTKAYWTYDGKDEDFKEGSDWRGSYHRAMT